MSWRNLPSLNSLRAFCAVAETGSYSAAGRVLNVTHAAVSQQVRGLEENLGITLVEREGRGVRISAEGRQLAQELAIGFGAIRRAVATIREEEDHRPVQVSTSPAFAVAWLMPRLVKFQSAHPGITLLINPTAELVELKPGGIDLAVRYNSRTAATPGVDAILVDDMVVVGAPAIVDGVDTARPGDLLHLPWLQELGTNEVADWFATHQVEVDRPPMISHMPGNLIMQAVRRGDGISYTARSFVDDEIRSGRLRELFCDPQHGVYYLVTRPGVMRKPVRAFVSWMRDEARKDGAAGLL